MNEILEKMRNLIEYVKDIEDKLDNARFHLRENLDLLSLATIKCLWYDGILSFDEIPEEILSRLSKYDDLMAERIVRFHTLSDKAKKEMEQ